MSTPEPQSFVPGTVRQAAAGLTALSLATFVAVTTEMVPVGLLPQLAADLDVTEPTAGLLVTVYALMVATLSVPLVIGTRALPRKGLLLSTLLAYTASNVLVALGATFAVVAGARAIGGVAHALFFSLSIGYGARLVAPAHTGRALALVTFGASAGFVLGVPLSTSLGTALGWRTTFWVLTALAGLAVVLVALVLPAVVGGASPASDGADTGSRRGRLTVVCSGNALTYLGQYTAYTYVAVVLIAIGLPDRLVGPGLLMLGGLGLLGIAYATRFLDRAPRRGALVVLTAMAVGLLGMWAAFPGMYGVLACAAVWSAGFGAVASTYQTAAIRTHGASPDVVGALVNATANVGIGGGAALGALVLDHVGLRAVLLTGAVLVALSLALVAGARASFPARA